MSARHDVGFGPQGHRGPSCIGSGEQRGMSDRTLATVLVVEDNELDVESLQRGFRQLKITNPMVWAKDGLEALAILRNEDFGTCLRRPYVVLLDLNMPRMGGIEFLKELRQDVRISDTSVFVLTTSSHPKDLRNAHLMKICGYIVKPLDRAEMMEVISMLNSYWSICELPLETSA